MKYGQKRGTGIYSHEGLGRKTPEFDAHYQILYDALMKDKNPDKALPEHNPPPVDYPIINRVGRKTKYDPSMCEIVIEEGRKGKSVNQMACACGVHISQLYDYEKKFPEFNDAMAIARMLSQAWWENKGQESLDNKFFQNNIYNKQMQCRFRHDYHEHFVLKTQQLGADGKPIDPVSKTDSILAAALAAVLGLNEKDKDERSEEPSSTATEEPRS